MNAQPSLTFLLLFALFGSFLAPVSADEIKLKNGETLTGRITYEADDIVKIEIEVSSTIKQTKIVGRGEILEIIKEAPDNIAFAEIEKLLPTPSLAPASAYESMIEKGPASFLRSFPDSQHAAKVKEIQATLEEELDKVERGFIKLGDEWISPQDRAEYSTLVESRITLLRMQNSMSARNYNGYINALREFEKLEEQYYGSPALPEGVKLAQEIIPVFGTQLQSMLRDVEYRNQQYEQNLAAMDEDSRLQVVAARQKEIDAYEAGVEADKKQGIKWVRLDPRSKGAIESYLKLASDELTRIRQYDVEALESQAKLLVKADQQAAKGELASARAILKEAAAITGQTVSTRSSSRKGSSGSYLSAISAKVSEKEAEEKAKAKAREEALASEALTANLKTKGSDDPSEEAGEEGTKESAEGGAENAAEGTAEASEGEPKKEKPVDDFSALANTKKEKGKEESSDSKPKKKEKPEPKEREERPRAEVVEESGGFPIMRIIQIATGLLLVTVVALKFLGGKKKD